MSKAPVRYRSFSTRCLRAPDDCFGSRLCENFNVRRARRSIFEKLRDMRTDNAADIRLNAMLGNCIFYISPMYEFSHSLDPKQSSGARKHLVEKLL